MAIIQTEVGATDVIEAMLEDGVFAEGIWAGIADELHKGSMLDDLMDIINSGGFDTATLRKIAGQFQVVSDMCAERLSEQ